MIRDGCFWFKSRIEDENNSLRLEMGVFNLSQEQRMKQQLMIRDGYVQLKLRIEDENNSL